MADEQMDPDDVEEQRRYHQKLKAAGFYDQNKTKQERLSIIERLKNKMTSARGGGGGGMKPDTDITASRKLPKMAKGGSVKSSASKRGDGCAQRGKTKGRMV